MGQTKLECRVYIQYHVCDCLRNGWSRLGTTGPHKKQEHHNVRHPFHLWVGTWLMYLDTKGKQTRIWEYSWDIYDHPHYFLALSVFNHSYNNYVSMTICCSFKITISALFKIFSSDVIFKKSILGTIYQRLCRSENAFLGLDICSPTSRLGINYEWKEIWN